jgi:hypothetical protein
MTMTHPFHWVLPCLLLSLLTCPPTPVWSQSSGSSGGGGSAGVFSGSEGPRRAPDGADEVRRLYQRGAVTATEICDAVAVLRTRAPAQPKALARAEALVKEQHIDCAPGPEKKP